MHTLPRILDVATTVLKGETLPIEVEYEDAVIWHYPVAGALVTPSGLLLYLGAKHTACLAPERCGASGDPCCG